MQPILVGINYSEQSPKVLRYAFRIAQFLDAKLLVAHYLDAEDPKVKQLNQRAPANRVEAFEQLRLESEEQLKDFIGEHRSKQFHSIPVQAVVGYGSAPEELSQLAQQEGINLLVMGKFTASGWNLFADTPEKVIRWTHCPVLIVPEDYTFRTISRIVYASNFELEDCGALLYLLPWLEAFKGATLTCIHICKNKEEQASAELKLDILRQLFPQTSVDFQVGLDQVTSGIDKYTDLHKSDLIVTLHRHRGLWQGLFRRSISKTLAKDVKVPMMIFRQR